MWMTQTEPAPVIWARPVRAPSTWRAPASHRSCCTVSHFCASPVGPTGWPRPMRPPSVENGMRPRRDTSEPRAVWIDQHLAPRPDIELATSAVPRLQRHLHCEPPRGPPPDECGIPATQAPGCRSLAAQTSLCGVHLPSNAAAALYGSSRTSRRHSMSREDRPRRHPEAGTRAGSAPALRCIGCFATLRRCCWREPAAT